jgi:hypothetical protein
MYLDFITLKGKTFKSVVKTEFDNDAIVFVTEDDKRYILTHRQDCCEHVYIHEIVGDLEDLVGSEIIEADESMSNEDSLHQYDESHTWSFYKIGTAKGFVTISFYGSSNGCYSESASLYEED